MDNKVFMQYIRILSRSGHKKFIIDNHTAWAYYDVDEDDDTGYHYSIKIKDPTKFDLPLFTEGIIDVQLILAEYKEYTKTVKSLYGTKVVEKIEGDGNKLTITTFHNDELKLSLDIHLDSHVDNAEIFTDKFADTMIRWGEYKLDTESEKYKIDSDFVETVMEKNDVVSVPFIIGGKKVKMPFTKSSWLQMKKFDNHTIEISKSTIKNIYQFIHIMDAKGFIQTRFGYVVSY